MTLAPVLRYPGAKWRISSWIVDQFPAHQTYVEPFFGSGAVFFAKAPSHAELINDLDGDVVNLFRVLRDPVRACALAQALTQTPWARDEWKESRDNRTDPHPDPIERARRFLVLAWQSHGQRLGYQCGWRHDGPMGAHSSVARQWQNLPARVQSVTARLRDAQIESVPALELIRKYRGSNVLLYCDPPYLGSTRREKKLYVHELLKPDEHRELLDALKSHPGPVVLSGYASALYDLELASWRRLTCTTVSEKGKPRTEVLWVNREAAKQGNLFGSKS